MPNLLPSQLPCHMLVMLEHHDFCRHLQDELIGLYALHEHHDALHPCEGHDDSTQHYCAAVICALARAAVTRTCFEVALSHQCNCFTLI